MASSQTLSPTFQGVNFWVEHSLMVWQAVSCAAIASFLASFRTIMQFSRAGRNVFPMDGYALGSYPSMRENGEVLVE